MFTGIIQAMGRVQGLAPHGDDVRIGIHTGDLPMSNTSRGDSIAVNGACLTAVELSDTGFAADVSRETLACTTLGTLTAGSPVNLEKALTPATPLGGHLVSGHVDGVGHLKRRHADARSVRLHFEVPHDLSHYVARKGSICVDGVSLTVNGVDGDLFDVNIVPHTLDATTLGALAIGDPVNLEVDLIARYLERLLAARES